MDIPAVIVDVYMSTSHYSATVLISAISAFLLSMWNKPFSSILVWSPWYRFTRIPGHCYWRSSSSCSDYAFDVMKQHDLPPLSKVPFTLSKMAFMFSLCRDEMVTLALWSAKDWYVFCWMTYESPPVRWLNTSIDTYWRNPSMTMVCCAP